MSIPEKKYRARVFGGILRWMNPQTASYEYVCVKGRKTAIWSFPKGHSLEGEDPVTCAEREIEEETGITYLPRYTSHLKLGSVHLYVYDLAKKYPVIAQDTREVGEVRWMTLEEMTTQHGNASFTEYVEKQLYRQSRHQPLLSIF